MSNDSYFVGLCNVEFELWKAFMREFLAFLILGEIARKMRKGRFPPFGSVFTEFELWEAVMRQFLAFFDFGVFRFGVT